GKGRRELVQCAAQVHLMAAALLQQRDELPYISHEMIQLINGLSRINFGLSPGLTCRKPASFQLHADCLQGLKDIVVEVLAELLTFFRGAFLISNVLDDCQKERAVMIRQLDTGGSYGYPNCVTCFSYIPFFERMAGSHAPAKIVRN